MKSQQCRSPLSENTVCSRREWRFARNATRPGTKTDGYFRRLRSPLLKENSPFHIHFFVIWKITRKPTATSFQLTTRNLNILLCTLPILFGTPVRALTLCKLICFLLLFLAQESAPFKVGALCYWYLSKILLCSEHRWLKNTIQVIVF